jgi:hypothetical protein
MSLDKLSLKLEYKSIRLLVLLSRLAEKISSEFEVL